MQATNESPKNQATTTRTFEADEAMVVRDDIDRISVIDAIDERLNQLDGIIGLLMGSVDDMTGEVQCSGRVLLNGLWAASSLVASTKQFSGRLN